ncbi:helix-turn-helix domain-containing protein [Arthrobacter sp. Helios]|uniref:winged helix-turn-helix domain-containing protein n=1 Tax=Arthrobacter sp. Helios TaxID=2828862 RepID=UPI002053C949|nr:helix-turn-helix domain-containing protein [Arthrobacter sp. Helios]UPO77521.1 helix-turn-helix domain-containing protein [Arthrobacter sp. Helios]
MAPETDSPEPRPSGSGRSAEISDPVRIRALAHPLRLALLDYLDKVPEGTATQCAAATGASVASCSYHLRILAKHGYIEQVQQPGREKPWRSPQQSRTHSVDPAVPGSQHALAALSGLLVTRESERIMNWVRTSSDLASEDVDAASILKSTFYATPAELKALREDIMDLLDQLAPRRTNPALRPPGSREVHYFSVTNFEPAPSPDAP